MRKRVEDKIERDKNKAMLIRNYRDWLQLFQTF